MTNALTAKQRQEMELSARMIGLYCADRHGAKEGLCAQCAALLSYVGARLQCCPYGDEKPTCRRCPIHCYRSTEREQIKEVMRYAGPRLLLHGDFSALRHLLHDRQPAPDLKRKKGTDNSA